MQARTLDMICVLTLLILTVGITAAVAKPMVLVKAPADDAEMQTLFNDFLTAHRPERVAEVDVAIHKVFQGLADGKYVPKKHQPSPLDLNAPYDHIYRKGVFAAKVHEIVKFNQKYYKPGNPDAPFLVVNKFADLTEEEMAHSFLGLNNQTIVANSKLPTVQMLQARMRTQATVPSYLDWRTVVAQPAVKNQGGCGSCWAFAGTEAIEWANSIATNQAVSLAAQQPLDCSGTDSCSGGNSNNAANGVLAQGGQCAEADYPYTAVKSPVCHAMSCAKKATHAGWVQLSSVTADNLYAEVAVQPSVIYLKAGGTAFGSYGGGILPAASCVATSIDHAVLMVGFNKTGNYFIVQNSWGAGWGENGFIRMEACGCYSCSWSGYPKAVGRCGLNPCPTGQICVNDASNSAGYRCECPTGTGATCMADSTGTCPTLTTCPTGFTGTNCATDINECATNNGGCGSAFCKNTIGSYHCECADGQWPTTPGQCQTCASCSFTCGACPAGYFCKSGVKLACDVGLWSVAGSTSCTACPAGYTCYNGTKTQCAPGYVSPQQSSVSWCTACGINTYANVGSCANCPAGYVSNVASTACTACPNVNGTVCNGHGTCAGPSPTCVCDNGWLGSKCETHGTCAMTPCQNGGACSTTAAGDYTCTCTGTYVGYSCEFNPCAGVTCKNGGSCTSTSTTTFACKCTQYYSGTYCDKIKWYTTGASCAITSALGTFDLSSMATTPSSPYNATGNGATFIFNACAPALRTPTDNDPRGAWQQGSNYEFSLAGSASAGSSPWTIAMSGAKWEYGVTIKYANGDSTYCGTGRTFTINATCGVFNGTTTGLSVYEPTTCNYYAALTHPAACHPDCPKYYGNVCGGLGTCVGSPPSCSCKPGYSGTACGTGPACASNPCQNGATCIEGVNSYKCVCATPYRGSTCAALRWYADGTPCSINSTLGFYDLSSLTKPIASPYVSKSSFTYYWNICDGAKRNADDDDPRGAWQSAGSWAALAGITTVGQAPWTLAMAGTSWENGVVLTYSHGDSWGCSARSLAITITCASTSTISSATITEPSVCAYKTTFTDPAACHPSCPKVNGVVCNGHGTCAGTPPVCTCASGYTAPLCT